MRTPPSSPTPHELIADAIRQRLFSRLHLGLLQPGAQLPSARDLAAELGASRRAVLAAYQELAREGLVDLRPRSGIYVATPAVPGAPGADALSRRARRVVQFLLQELADGVPAPLAPDRLHQVLDTLRLRVAAVECNDDQLTTLAGELATDYGLETSAMDVEALGAAAHAAACAAGDPARMPPLGFAPLAVRRAHLLVTTPFHAGAVKAAAEQWGKPWLAVSTRTDMPAEIARLLPAGPVYVVVTDPRFATKLGRVFAASPGAGNLHPLVVGRDAVAAIPAGAPTYVTGCARERLERAGEAGAAALLARGTPEPRALSPRSAADLLTFMVRENLGALADEHAA
ncbi:hypothetical protein tb265_45040 [Gemmatimonadetes bacterium T265]|nr:hypothetical protein tb265_45040 [Gemmatimonadetes bacterium T265]